ncbi:MAG: FmdB family zinc ribbon protein [Anaerolineaceae bacterium]
MAMFEYLCDSCGAFFDVDMETVESETPVECPVCRSHDTQVIPSLASVYGYSGATASDCGNDNGFR